MKKFTNASVILFTFLLLIQCDQKDVIPNNLPNLRTLSAGEEKLVQTTNEFAFNLFKTVNEASKDKNVFISPLSVNIALNMTINGASGETKEEMKQTLGIEHLSDKEANAAVRDLTDLLLSMDKKVSLKIANSIWYKEVLTLKNGFHQLIQDYYDGKIEGLDFSDPKSKDIVNGWVEDKTNGKIKDLIRKTDNSVVMILVNAIYFKADWKYQFEKAKTEEDQFTLESGVQIPVEMMFSKGVKLRHFSNESLQLLDIPYGNGQFSMVVLLPHAGKTTQDIMSSMSAQNFKSWMEQADTLTPQLYLPKFTMKFRADLKETLMDMGMVKPFGFAEFNGFFEETKSLAISKVIHQTFIKVDEEGSEAAAATAVKIIEKTSAVGRPVTIRVDHPFVFFIYEKHSGTILFAGKMMNPSLSS